VSAEGLRYALAALDTYWAERDPRWAAGLRSGLTEDAINSLENLLVPLHLTDEHHVLYRWHDGDGESHAFGENFPWFIPLAAAIEWWGFGKTELGWTPCWFPLLNLGQDYRISLIDIVPEETAGVLDFYLQDEPKPLVPSIEALVRWHLDCLTHGLVDNDGTSEHQIAVEKLREPYMGPILVRGQPIKDRFSATFARDWPSAWKEAAGIDEAVEVPVGPTTTVAKLLGGDMVEGVIQGRVSWLGGGLESSIAQIDDGTGRVLVACPQGTPGARELGMDLVIELTVKPRQGPVGDDLAFLEGVMGHAPFVAESVRFVRSLRQEDDPRADP
jgi:cell wall assembly regulator SMI1